jgi:hypothetical protein
VDFHQTGFQETQILVERVEETFLSHHGGPKPITLELHPVTPAGTHSFDLGPLWDLTGVERWSMKISLTDSSGKDRSTSRLSTK